MTDSLKQTTKSDGNHGKGKQPWWRWLVTVLAIALFVYVISKQGWGEFLATLESVSLPYALAGLLLLFVSRQAVAARWYSLLKISKKPIQYLETVKLTYAGLFASNFLPSSIGGDLVRYIGLTQRGVDGALVLASLISDRVIGMAGMSLLVPIGLYVVSLPLSLTSMTITRSHLQSVSTIGIAFRKLWDKLIGFVKSTFNDLWIWLKHPKSLVSAFIFTIIHEFVIFGMIWLFLYSLGETISYWTVAGLYSLSYLATLIPLSIGGLGIQEMSITYLFSQFGTVSMQAALALAILNRMAFVINSFPGVIFLPAILKEKDAKEISNKKRDYVKEK